MTVATQDARLDGHEAVRGYVERVCFKTGPPGRVGVELEWLVADTCDPTRPVPLARVRELLAAAGPPPAGSAITFEPGGQVELSSLPYPNLADCVRGLSRDVAHVRQALAGAGLAPLPTALDPYRPPRRQLTLPRYQEMAAYFAAIGAAEGPVMMNSTAATQVNLDIGRDAAQAARRWHLLHALGPVLVAAFANSPVHAGSRTGWRCGRQRVWQRLEPARTAPPRGADPVQAWTDFALAAPVMLHRPGRRPGPVTFGDWLAVGDGRGPGPADLDLHLSSLFPPVRPRGYFEVRYVDALPLPWWPVPVAVLAGLVEDEEAGALAARACAGVDDWAAAARDGYAVPGLHRAATACFALAAEALAGSPDLADLVGGYADAYVARRRCPADDLLEERR